METLRSKLIDITQQALQSGALQSIETRTEDYTESGIPYQLRVLDNLKRKAEAGRRQRHSTDYRTNPFLPHDPALYLGELGPDHRCLLNKFNVLPHHLLIVSREFESQNARLSRGDFRALAQVMAEIDGLAFFNGGTLAGASQPHKHLQLVPDMDIPFASILESLSGEQPQQIRSLLFRHSVIGLPPGLFENRTMDEIAKRLDSAYQRLMLQLAIKTQEEQVLDSYNLLLNRHWMLMVPRTQESVAGISFNSLAFCGSILVPRAEDLVLLKQHGLMKALRQVSL